MLRTAVQSPPMTNRASHSSGSKRTLSIGGATFDLFVKADASLIHDCGDTKSFALPLGGKIRVNDVISACGGGADNTAVGLSRLGFDAAFSGVLGDDEWGKAIRENMEKEGVDTRYLAVIEHEPSSFSLILTSPGGERTILTHKSMDRHFGDVTFDREALSSADAVYLNHIHQDTCEIEDDLLRILAESPAIHLTWNPGGAQVEAGMKNGNSTQLVARTNLLLLNKEEALAFTGKKTVREAMHVLVRSGAKRVVVTDGPHGCIATDGKDLYTCPSLQGDIVDSTGAGDAFGTAATWAVLSGKDLPTTLKAGTINAMSVVGAVGAQKGLLTETQIQSKLEQTALSVTVEQF